MLVRSSSTPILGSLLPPFSHSDPLPGASQNESFLVPENAKFPPTIFRSTSNLRKLTSAGSQNRLGCETFSGEEVGRDLHGEMVLWRRFRRAQSENDLRSLFLGSAATRSRFCASSVLCSDKFRPSLNKRKESCNENNSLPSTFNQSRRRSLSCIPSSFLGSAALDKQDFIPEDGVETPTDSIELANVGGVDIRTVFGRIGISCVEESDAETLLYPAKGTALQLKNTHLVGMPRTFLSDAEVCNTRLKNKEEKEVPLGLEEQGRVQRSVSQLVNIDKYRSIGSNDGVSVAFDSRPAHCIEQSRLPWRTEGGDVGGTTGAGGSGKGRPRSTCTGEGPGAADADFTDLIYQKMLSEDPGHPLLLMNYAQFLMEAKRDYNKAEEYYQRAILANPGDGHVLAHYGKLIWDRHRDHERAASYFERAVQATPDDSYVMAAYASFLWDSEEEDEEEGETATAKLPSLPSLVSA